MRKQSPRTASPKPWWILPALCALALLAYARSFENGFALDANTLVLQDPRIRQVSVENLQAIALREYLVVTREVDPTANEEARVQHVMKGYRADTYSQVETLVYMAFTEHTHAVFCRNLAARIEEPMSSAGSALEAISSCRMPMLA